MHFIREETLKLFVLQRIFDVTALFFDDAMAFEEAAKKQHFQEAEKEAQKRKREIAQAEKRIAELDRIFKRIYEDDISGTISHERFLKLSTDYEAEQRELTEQVKTWREVVEIFEQDRSDFDSFAAIVRKYVGIRELTPTIVNEFVKKIIVHAPDKSSGHRRQKIELVWNFIGEVNLPGDDQTVERQKKAGRHDLSAMPPCDNQIIPRGGAGGVGGFVCFFLLFLPLPPKQAVSVQKPSLRWGGRFLGPTAASPRPPFH